MSNCPECGGKMKYQPDIKHLVCQSCGLSLYWQKVRNERVVDADAVDRAKSRRKEWLDWYSQSKKEKENY
ncbi:MAG: hypothetical protein ACXACC_06425 [Promethearchaeota archaeon]|jgi:hypothetical protein